MWHLIVKGMCLNVWFTLWKFGWSTFSHGNPGNGLHCDWSLFGLSYGEVGYNSVLTHARGSQKDTIVNVSHWNKRSIIQQLPMYCALRNLRLQTLKFRPYVCALWKLRFCGLRNLGSEHGWSQNMLRLFWRATCASFHLGYLIDVDFLAQFCSLVCWGMKR